MKSEITKLLKLLEVDLISYKTYRSDFGCQVYELMLEKCGRQLFFQDSYFVGGGVSGEYIIGQLKKEISIELL